MKKLLPVILALAVIGVGALLFMNRGSGNSVTDISSPDSSSSETFSGALKDAIKLGVAMKCSYEVAGNEYEGYIKGKNYRGMMKTAEGKMGEVIVKDNCMWTWTAEDTQGMKFCFDESEGEELDMWEQPQTAAAADMTYTCVPTAITDAKFTPPSNINFLSLDEMMKGMGN